MQTLEKWTERYAFKSKVPASDDPGRLGWHNLSIEDALTKTFVRTNPAKLTSMIVIDVDREHAEDYILSRVWDDEEAPEPNWITTNLATSHAHAGYWLAAPVSTSDVSSYRARSFMYDTQKRLTVALSGDEHYTHNVTRSPFKYSHVTKFLREDPYTLKQMAETLKEIQLLPTYSVDTTQGRNVALFDTVREQAYKVRRTFTEYGKFANYVLSLAEETNFRLNSNLLPDSEVKSIARSISRWTWKVFTPGSLSRKQSAVVNKRWAKVRNGDITNEKRLLTLAEVREEVVFLRSRGATHAEIANLVGLTKEQVKSRLQYARRMNELGS